MKDRGPWIQTYSGKAFHLLDPSEDEVALEDIAHALALKCRFTGHSAWHYSVAQHCVLGAVQMASPDKALAFLLHELGEVYLPDVASPLKSALRWSRPGDVGPGKAWWDLEDLHSNVALRALGLDTLAPLLHCPEVVAMDRAMLMTEAKALMPGGLLPGWGYPRVAPADTNIKKYAPLVVKEAWLDWYRILRAEAGL